MTDRRGPWLGPRFIGIAALLVGAFAFAQDVSAPQLPTSLPTPIPRGTDLEAQGAVIGEIFIRNGDVFATDTPEENYSLFRLANTLHIETKPDTIRQQLLFAAGQQYVHRLILESERILRSNRYLFDAEIVPVSFANGVVNLEVRTRDVWTLKPGITYARTGGTNTIGFELQESNLLGYGKDLAVGRRETVDRTANEIRYVDPHLFGSWNRLSAAYSSNSDGRRRSALLDRPFYALDSRWAVSTSALEWDRTDQRYNLGAVVDEFRHHQEVYDLGLGWSPGLSDGWVRRFSVGWRYLQNEFASTQSALSAASLPGDRTLSYPNVGFSMFSDEFEERRNQDQIERTEDLYTGTVVQASLGAARESWNSDRNAWIWTLGAGQGYESTERKHTVVWSLAASGRFEDEQARNVVATADARYYWRVTDRQLFFASMRGTAVEELDAERQLLLGGDNGLRGYPLRYQDGTAQALLTLEHRVFTRYYLFRLFHVGGAVFFDAGRSWGHGNAPTNGVDTNEGLLTDAGFGLRLGSSRSAFGNVIHIDVAFPFNGDSNIDRVQFIVETKRSF